MALNKPALKEAIAALLTDMMEREEASIEEFATRLSDAVDAYVKTATINYISGLVAGPYPVTGAFTGNLT